MTTELNSGVPAGAPAVENVPPVQPQTEQDRLITQSQFDKAAGSIRESAYQKARADVLAEMQKQPPAPQQQSHQAPAPQVSGSLGGMQQVNSDEIRRMIAEETQKTQAQQEQQKQDVMWQQTVGSFYQRIAAAKEDHPDIEQKVLKLNLASIPEVVVLANSLENTADFVNDLHNNPHKLATLVNLARTPGLSHLAIEEAQKLSNSLKANKQARSEKTANEPLSHVNPSISGTDSGNLSQDDFRNQDWLRG